MMKALNRFYGFIWMIFSILAIWFWQHLQGIHDIWQTLGHASWVCMLYLFYNSRAIRSKNSLLLFIGLTILMVGLMFRFFNWMYSYEIILLSAVFILTGYTLFVIRRTRRTWLDLLKLLWVSSTGLSFLWYMLRLPYVYYAELLPTALIWPLYLAVCTAEAMGYDQSEEVLPEEAGQPDDIL